MLDLNHQDARNTFIHRLQLLYRIFQNPSQHVQIPGVFYHHQEVMHIEQELDMTSVHGSGKGGGLSSSCEKQ